MFASDLNQTHTGLDITITVNGVLTGGIIRTVSRTAGMVTVDVDGQEFTLHDDIQVKLAVVDLHKLILVEQDAELRATMIDSLRIVTGEVFDPAGSTSVARAQAKNRQLAHA